ncbi:MAG: TerB N-terminal domain-containing protein, partial [Treponema sp.]|nr:TerB N-terminal domain-containing protein [Treponema sp.]
KTIPAKAADSFFEKTRHSLIPVMGGNTDCLAIGSGCFRIESKFRNMPISGYLSEQDEFYSTGESGSLPLTEAVSYRQLSQEEKNYFFYWRSEFRAGRIRETLPAFICIYARELVLRMNTAGAAASAFETLEELHRLWKNYRKIFPNAMDNFPAWLLDFSVIHNVIGADKILSGVVADILANAIAEAAAAQENFAGTGWPNKLPDILIDLYLHKKYSEENNSLSYFDFYGFIAKTNSINRPDDFAQKMKTGMEDALNSADTNMRKTYGKKLLEFFCPLPSAERIFNCFDGLPDLGNSSYTAQWLSYSGHKPFRKFISSLSSFVEYRTLKKMGCRVRAVRQPEPIWKKLCGFAEDPPDVRKQFSMDFEPQKLDRLREESDAVMEMLRVEDDSRENEIRKNNDKIAEKISAETKAPDRRKSTDIAAFVNSLDKTARGCLDLLSQDKGSELENFARAGNGMAESIVDEINMRFLRECGDLLIANSLDGHPVIQEEYRDEVIWALTFQNG